jgi:signal transduction histidine kinase
MKKDIFLSTKKKIIAISMVIVFLSLVIFAIITQVLYSSRVFDSVDHLILEQEKFLTDNSFNPRDYGEGFDVDDFIPPKNELRSNAEIKPGNKSEDQIRSQYYNNEENLDIQPRYLPPNLIVIIYKNNSFEGMSKNLYIDEEDLPILSTNAEDKLVTITSNGYNFRGIMIHREEYKIEIIGNVDAQINSLTSLRSSILLSLVILTIIAIALSVYLASRIIIPVKEAYEKQVYFVQDASHEMRTPLAVIKGKLELLAHSWGDTIDQHFEHISKMMSEVRGLEKLNSDLLLLSKEDLHLSGNITTFKLIDFTDDLSDFYLDLAEIKDKTFNVIGPKEEILVQWDYDKIKRAVVILIENAFKYTAENGKINLSIEDMNKYIKITVKDNGIGIKVEEQKRIFDRFYRSDVVRGENISGTGIGLSLLKSISKNFGVKIKLNSEFGVGSEFSLIIPKIIK